MALLRLDKYLADAGIGTRTQVKSYIKKESITINGETAKRPDIKVNTEIDSVTFEGSLIQISDQEYYILNKPAGYVSARKDNTAPTVMELIHSNRKDLSPIGRLDKDTEGLLLITNDGELAHNLLSPRHHVDKTYYATIQGIVTKEDIIAFQNGLHIGDEDLEDAMPATLIIEETNTEKEQSNVLVTIQEGKFHQIKRMFHAVGKEVIYLKRIRFGTLTLPDDLPLGESRPLTAEELSLLKKK